MDYVGPESDSVARSWEKKFRETRSMASIIFVSVDPTPTPNGMTDEYTVTLGLARNKSIDNSTGLAIIYSVLQQEVESGLYKIRANIYRGVSGASYEGDAGPGEAPP